MDFPRTPSPPPPPPPTPPEVLEPMDLSSERGVGGPDPGQDLGDQDQYNDGGQNPPRQNQVGTVLLRGVHIVSLYIDGERLCLAQISNTLLKNFSYNEIHNRRVALGITCVQCTPVQLEILRRAGAMPISSRRCGMITKREAERLVKSFLEEHAPPKLPDNFAFKVVHSCGWGCKGSFIPSRYNSSRAKCIKCTYCNLFFSPNKFIFHYHRMPDSKYRHPDAANFNSWRRHLDLDYDPNTDDLIHAWEDVKAMFNGGSRKRLLSPSDHSPPHESEKRPRMSLDTPSMPKLNHNRSCSVFPQVNGVPNLFPQQPPYGNFPMMHNDMDNMNPDRRVCVPDIWRPKNAMPYYNPLGLMWAKNFGFCPPAANMKPDVMREAGLRMPNVFMDMNGNKPSLDPHRTRPMVCKTNKSRNSAFRPVGNFQTPFPGVEGEGLGQPLTAPSSDHSDDFSEPAEDEEDEDIDVEGAREEDTTYDSSLPLTHDLGPQAAASSPTDSPTRYLQHSPPQYHSPSPGQLATSPPQYSTSPVHKDALPAPKSEQHSFTIDRLFDTKPDTITTKPATDLLTSLSDSLLTSRPKDELNGGESGQVAVTMATGQPAPYSDVTTVTASQQSCGDDQTEAARTPTDTSKDLGYILELSKEQLQSELLKMLGVNKLKGDVDSHAAVALMAGQQSIQRDTAPQT